MSESSTTPQKETTLAAALGSVTVTETEAAVFIEMLARDLPLTHDSLRNKMFDTAGKLAYPDTTKAEPAHSTSHAQRVA